MIRAETEKIAALTRSHKSYLNDLDNALAVFDAQETHANWTTLEEKRKLDNELIILRAKVENPVLVKNYNLSDFIIAIDSSLQDLQNYMMKRDENNCWAAYIIEYTWKIIQVKMALMVR